MRTDNSKLTLVLLSLTSLALLFLLGLAVYSIRVNNEETARLLNEANETEEEKALAQSVRTLIKAGKEEIEAFENLALSADRLVPAIESVEEAGRRLGLITEIVSVDKSEAKDGEPQRVNLAIESRGNWPGTLAFLQAIESLPHRVVIDEARLEKVGSTWRARLSIALYSFN